MIEEGPRWLDDIRDAGSDAEIIVSAGPYNPGRAGAAIAGVRPFWADIPGDPLAELAALSQVTPGGLSQLEIAAAHSAAVQVLSRADAISVISTPQRHATLGQLGLLGRTLQQDEAPPIFVLPITASFNLGRAAPRSPKPGHPLVLALSGAFNPWVDDQEIASILEAVFARRSDLNVICTGGGIEGFYEAGYERFKAFAAKHTDRIELLGWLPHEDMAAALKTAHVGLSIDRPGPEPELGSRTRLLLFAELGLMPITTVRCALTQAWADAGALIELPFQDTQGAVDILSSLHSDRTVTANAQHQCQSLGVAAVTAPLTAWSQTPRRTAESVQPAAALAAELDASRDALNQLYSSPTWTALNRLHTLGQAAVSRLKVQSE